MPISVAQAQNWEVSDADREVKLAKRMRAMVEKDPFNDYAFNQLRKRAPALGGVDKLIEEYQAQVAETPDDEVALVLLVRLYEAKGEPETALRYAVAAQDAGAGGWQMILLRGVLKAETGDAEGAKAEFEAALEGAPNKREKTAILRELGDLHRRLGKVDEAVDAYLRIVELSPKDEFLRWELADLFFELEEWERCLEQYQAAVKLAGRNMEKRARAELEIATIYQKMGRFEEAIEVYDDLLSGTKESHWLYTEVRLRLVEAYRSAGDLEGLLARLDKRLERKSKDRWALSLKGAVSMELGKPEEALEAYGALFEKLEPFDEEAYQSYVLLLANRGEAQKLDAFYARILSDLKDDDRRFQVLLEYASRLAAGADAPLEAYATLRRWEDEFQQAEQQERLAKAYLELGSYEDAVKRSEEIYEAIMLRDGERVEALRELLIMAIQRGDADRQEELLTRFIAHEDFDAYELGKLLDVYQSRSMTAQANAAVKLALARSPEDISFKFMYAQTLPQIPPTEESIKAWREILLSSDVRDHLKEASAAYLSMLRTLDVVSPMLLELERAYAADPMDWRRGRALFLLYLQEARVDDALDLLSSLEAYVANGPPLEELALSTLKNEPDVALILTDRLVLLRPTTAWRYHLEAAALHLDHNHDPALVFERLEAAATLAPDNEDVHSQAAEIYARMQRYEDAFTHFERAVELAPNKVRIKIAQGETFIEAQTYLGGEYWIEGYAVLLDALPLTTTQDEVERVLNTLITTARNMHGDLDRLQRELRAATDLMREGPLKEQVLQAIVDLPTTFYAYY